MQKILNKKKEAKHNFMIKLIKKNIQSKNYAQKIRNYMVL